MHRITKVNLVVAFYSLLALAVSTSAAATLYSTRPGLTHFTLTRNASEEKT